MRALDYAPVRKLLTRFATKAQRAGGQSCSQKIDAKAFPELFNAASGEDADFHWSLLKDAAALCGVVVSLKPTKNLVAEYERERCPKLEILKHDLPKLLDTLSLAPLAPRHRDEWRAALLSGLAAPSTVAEALVPFTLRIDGRTHAEVVEALNHVLSLKNEPLRLREVSSQAFWGLSKVLDDRTDMVAKLLELDECPFAPPPIHLSIRLPHGAIKGVLFVENKTTFDTLNAPEAAELALIYSAGFLASAGRLTSRADVATYLAADSGLSTENAELMHSFLFDAAVLPCYFFGDLDYSGMAILKAMRQNFPTMQAWDPGYRKLLTRLTAGNGHTPAAARKDGQRDPELTGCPLADEVLLPSMRKIGLFVDQE
jgi:hypothetical protein